MIARWAALVAALGCLLPGMPGAFAREVRVATFNILNGTGDIDSAAYNATKAVLARMDADVVCFQELYATTYAEWTNMAAELGYSYAAMGGNNSLSDALYLGYFSRFPILATNAVQSPPGANELARLPFRAVIAVPDAQRPLVLWTMHHKSSDGSIDKFRRAIEAQRISQDVVAYLADHPDHVEYVLTGDMNDDVRDSQTPAQFASQPSGAPAAYALGTDIVFPVPYAVFPTDRYADAGHGLLRVPAFWEGTATPITRPASGRQLDYVFLSPALMISPLGAPQSEVYYSDVDAGYGLPKWGDPLPSGTSLAASDHLPVFVDIQMADYSPVMPSAGFASAGEAGGPFAPEYQTYVVTETNDFATAWSVATDVDWLSADIESIALQPFESVEVDVFLNDNAAALPPGVYAGAVEFFNETTGLLETRTATLTVRDYLAVLPADDLAADGIVGGPFSPAAKTYVVTNKSAAAMPFSAAATENWLTVTPASWLLQAGETVTVTVALNANADGLPIGLYQDIIAFSNQVTGLVEKRPVSLAVAGRLCDAVDHCDLAWATGGNADWRYQTDMAADGIDAAQSGALTTNQSSWMETVVTGPFQISFSWGVSSRSTHYLRFQDNGTTRAQISGEVDWNRQIFEIASGVHTLRWVFATTATMPQGANSAWLDQVDFNYWAVSPAEGWMASGFPGGPFAPAARIYVLTNSGSDAFEWIAATDADWLSIAPAGGELAPGGSVAVECSLNAQANALPFGTYAGSVVFSNQTTGATLRRAAALAATGPLCEAVDRCDLAWTSGGTSNWFSQTNVTFDGSDAAQSGRISTNQHSWFETTVTGPVQVGFQWRVSSRTNSHYLRFQIDGANQASISGTSNWNGRSFTVAAGVHVLRWVFTNSTGAAQGSNAAWVDQVMVDYLTATPTSIWYPSIPAGGSPLPTTREYVLTNAGPTAIAWTAGPTVDWLSVDSDGGELEPGGSAIVECGINANAASLPPGSYAGAIAFSNLTSGSVFTRQVSLTVRDYLVVNPSSSTYFSGYIGGPYSPAWQPYAISNSGPLAIDWAVAPTSNWITVSPAGGTLGAGATGQVATTINGNAGALTVAGWYTTRLVFTNETTHLAQTRTVYLDVEEPLAVVAPAWMPAGPVGGPFAPAAAVFVLTNRGYLAQSWTVASSAGWLSLDAAGGTLASNAGVQVGAYLNAAAAALPIGTYPATLVFSNQTTGATIPQSLILSVGTVFCEAVEACGLEWTLTGDSFWFSQTNSTHDGSDAAASGPIAYGQETGMQTDVTGPGTLSFWWQVSSQTNGDYLVIWIDDIPTNYVSGELDWQPQTFVLGSGAHTLRWSYLKYSETAAGADRGWVDQISWTPARTARGVPIAWYERFGLAPAAGQTWDDLDLLPAASDAPNWMQYLAGLDPTNADDVFRITAIRQTNGLPLQIEWWGGTNGPAAPYVVQGAVELDPGDWEPVGTAPRAAGVTVWTNPLPADPRRFYRILAPPDP